MPAFFRTGKSSDMSQTPLSDADLRTILRMAPLISIDLIIRNPEGQVLLGLRKNEPAKGYYFVPGGRIWKNESLRDAFARILRNETSCVGSFDDARLLGVYEHFYDTNRFRESSYGTHYVALGYEFKLGNVPDLKVDMQHEEFRWWDEIDLLMSDRVHRNTKSFFG